MVSTTPVTIEQAAALMGVSATTIRRRIKAGELQVTETRRPQGIVWLVHLPPGIHSAADVDTAPSTEPAAPPSSNAQAEAISGLVQITVAAVLGPLVAELAASRQTNERQAQEIGQLREDRGRLTAELERAAATVVSLSSVVDAHTALEQTPASVESPVPFWRSWGPWLVVVAGIVVVALLALLLTS